MTESFKPNASPPVAEESDLGVRLVGTILEPGATFAMIVDQSATIDLRSEGDILALEPSGIRLDRVEAEWVVVSYLGRFQTLHLTELEESHDEEAEESTGTQIESDSMVPDSLDDELDWLNGELPPPANDSSAGSR